jgi:HK97 family phage portal protein
MSILKNIFRREAVASTSSCSLAEAIRSASSSDVSKRTVLKDRDAMAIPTAFRCMQVLSEGVANLSLRYMRLQGEVYKEYDTHPLHYLLKVQPNENMNAYTFISLIVQQLYHGTGNAYVYPRYIDGEIYELVLLNPNSVTHDTINDTYFVADLENGVYGTFKESQILHIFRFTEDGKDGVSVMKYASRTMSIAATGDQETWNRFSNGGNVMGFVTNDKSVRGYGEYQDRELKATAESLDSLFHGGTRIASLPGQTGFQQISLSSTDMQFLESRKFTIADICRIYGVPRGMVFDDTSTNYKSVEMQQVAFLTNTINPILRRIENEFTRKLIPRTLCCKRLFQFDRRELYSCDLESLANYQMKTIQSGIYSVNDWRIKENQEPIAGGDRVLVSTNLAPIDSAKLTGEQKQG